ncbi:hypothetical protein R3W88_011785 [Solanum pinnatisectum]|uniref:Protein TAR1 n=1 Tax=Solanum pinnatisectum TaxID=50273 RepID=A0AAV9L766_9SOLN|nr:hypothetical protein R3W88_011785 [Solanum pinnatisectum]
MCKCRLHGTFPLFSLQSSHLNICYYHQYLHQQPLRPGSHPRFCSDRRTLLLIGAWHLTRRSGVEAVGADLGGSSKYSNKNFEGRRGERVGGTPIDSAFHGRIESLGFGRPLPPIYSGPRPKSIGEPARHRSTSDRGASLAPIHFPPNNFKYSLTLFSKSFSSFPRDTCLISVSRPYLSLDGIHCPIWAAYPNNPTRRQCLVVRQGPGTTGLSPSLAPPSRGLGPGPPLRTLLHTTIQKTLPHDSKAGLFPVLSSLLRESL